MIVIAFHGAKKSGKTFSSEKLTNVLIERGYEVVRDGFSHPMKKAVCDLFEIENDERADFIENMKTETISIGNKPLVNGRKFLQLYGVDTMYGMFGNDVWIKMMIDRIQNIENQKNTAVLIDDMRFPLEAEMMKEAFNTKVIYLPRRPEGEDTHISEQPLNQKFFDYVLDCGIDEVENNLAQWIDSQKIC